MEYEIVNHSIRTREKGANQTSGPNALDNIHKSINTSIEAVSFALRVS